MKYQAKNKLIGFNERWVASVTFEAFKAHESHHGLTDRQLREIHSICRKSLKGSSSGGSKDEDIEPAP